MSYKTYTTEALVCGTFNRNTADRSYLLFTREAGMLYANARSVREERSKQRYSLQDFSLIRVSLIKGKAGWKVGSVQAVKNYYATAPDKEARGSVVLIYRQLRRFLSGEEAAPALFDYVNEALETLSREIPHRQWVEKVVQARILTELGYVDTKKVPRVVIESAPAMISQTYEPTLVNTIDLLLSQAVSSSHL